MKQPAYLPMTRQEMLSLNWPELDVLLLTGDFYLDHPSSGAALIGRWLVKHGYRTGIIHPDMTDPDSVNAMGTPALFVGITAGSMDSLMAHYTPFRKLRRDDPYMPGGLKGDRPNRACIVYAGMARRSFPGVPVILGGLEASLRRFAHYDFMKNTIRRPLAFDARADMIIWGMAEKTVLSVARALESKPVEQIRDIPGTAYIASSAELPDEAHRITLPSYEEICAEPHRLIDSTLSAIRYASSSDLWAVQYCNNRPMICTPPSTALIRSELNSIYNLPFTRLPHPSINKPLPVLDMIKDSITSHRGCAGGCAFCALAIHQGRRILSRTPESIFEEINRIRSQGSWHGSISDIGGPTANMWGSSCSLTVSQNAAKSACTRLSCLYPDICPNFSHDQEGYADLLLKTLAMPGVRHVRVASGIRHDLALKSAYFTETLIRHFIGGQIKLAPEHSEESVLKIMHKPSFEHTREFLGLFRFLSRKHGLRQFPVLYLMSAHPGCTYQDMIRLRNKLTNMSLRPRQIQCFTPLPGTLSAAYFAARLNRHGQPIPVADTDRKRIRQHKVIIPA